MPPASPLRCSFQSRLAASLLASFLLVACQAPLTEIPDSITKDSHALTLAGKTVMVDFYHPRNLEKAPVVVVAHGFSRNRRYMAGWGVLLAKNGFTALVLDQPYRADHASNGKAIAELLQQVQTGDVPLLPKPDGRSAVIGMSMGGLTTLLAISHWPVNAWIGLDPVDAPDARGAGLAKGLNVPAAVFLAEPSAWNAHGNARKIIDAFPRPPFAIKVNGASHCDTESPTDLVGSLATGGTSPARLAVYEQYLVAYLKMVFQKDPAAEKQLDAARNDKRVTVIDRTTAR